MQEKPLPTPPNIDYRGVLEFTFTPADGGEVTKNTVTITEYDPQDIMSNRDLLKKACLLVQCLVDDDRPAMQAFRKEVETFCAEEDQRRAV